MVSDVDQKIYKVFWREKILLWAIDFLQLKVLYIFCFMLDSVQIRRNFFPLGNHPYAKKSKRDSLYFDLLPGPFKSAIIFLSFVQLMEDNKVKIQLLFLSFFLLLFDTTLYW